MQFTIDLDDKGDFVGDVPAELSAILKRVEAEHHKIGYGKGSQQAAADAKKQIEDAIAHEKARLEAMQPLERERISRIESENSTLTARISEAMKESDRTIKSREESHAKEIVRYTDQLKQRDDRIRSLTTGQLRAAASAAGARDESLEELEVVLDRYIGYDDDMRPFVKNTDGTPQLAGKPVGIDAFVKQYLDNHPHHRKSTVGRGGDARGGSTLRAGIPGGHGNAAASLKRLEEGDRSPHAIAEAFSALRQKRATG